MRWRYIGAVGAVAAAFTVGAWTFSPGSEDTQETILDACNPGDMAIAERIITSMRAELDVLRNGVESATESMPSDDVARSRVSPLELWVVSLELEKAQALALEARDNAVEMMGVDTTIAGLNHCRAVLNGALDAAD